MEYRTVHDERREPGSRAASVYDAPMADRSGESMTVAQRDALARELAELEGPKRAEMVEAIATAVLVVSVLFLALDRRLDRTALVRTAVATVLLAALAGASLTPVFADAGGGRPPKDARTSVVLFHQSPRWAMTGLSRPVGQRSAGGTTTSKVRRLAMPSTPNSLCSRQVPAS